MRARFVVAALAALASQAAFAGPPFLTDDPEPTDTGYWEIYAPLMATEGRGVEFEGTTGIELNYGAAPDLQLTFGLPLAFSHDSSGWARGIGHLELSAKYRFYHDEEAGLSIAAFPGVTLPTARRGLGPGRVTAFLPVWAQKDIGPWSLFGGGGYTMNAGAGSQDYWSGGAALTRTFGEHFLLGIEADRQGPGMVGERPSTSFGIGAICRLKAPLRLLASGGPTFGGGGGPASFHMFVALGIDL
jgi:hypothetical protein